MRPRSIPARIFDGTRIIAEVVTHKTGKRVPIFETVFIDENKRYPHGSEREEKRRMRHADTPNRFARQYAARQAARLAGFW